MTRSSFLAPVQTGPYMAPNTTVPSFYPTNAADRDAIFNFRLNVSESEIAEIPTTETGNVSLDLSHVHVSQSPPTFAELGMVLA